MGRKHWSSAKIFARLLTNKTRKTYWDNVRELRSRATPEVFDQAAALLASQVDREVIIGVDVLAQLGWWERFDRPAVLDLLFELLDQNPSPHLLNPVLVAIGHNNEALHPSRIQQLQTYQNHRFSDVRFGLVHALSGLEDPVAINTLLRLTTDRHPSVRDWATFSLGTQIDTHSEAITQALWARLRDPHRHTQLEAIAGLTKRKDPRIKDLLVAELQTVGSHDSLILDCIVELNDPDFIPLLEKQLGAHRLHRGVEEQWLLDALHQLRRQG
ncbi:MAG: hypothetical protein AAFW73_19865 [Bacteroidota bacterium]